MSLELVIDNADLVRTEALTWPDRARALVIVDNATYSQAAELLKGIKSLRQRIAKTFDLHISKAFQVHRGLVDEKRKAEAPLAEAEGIIKRGLVAFDTEQDRLRREEEARIAAELRKREEEERLARALEAEAEGATAEEIEEVLTVQALIAPVILPKATPKVSGISYRENWKADVVDFKALVNAAAADDRWLGLLEPNTTAIGGLARSLKANANIPGVRVYEKKEVAASGRTT